MDTNFDKCLAFVLKEEGGNDDDPNDHGGRTSRGITQREWDKFRLTHTDRPEDVWKASDDDIKTIYHTEYWLPHCSSLPAGLDLVYFDFGVNAGIGQAVKKLQVALGITVDGAWGPQTEAASKAIVNVSQAIDKFSDARETFYHGLAQYSRYGKGWSGRTERCRHAAQLMIGSTPASPKANPVDTKTNKTAGPATVIVGTTAATVAANHFNYSPLIFVGAAVTFVVAGILIHYFLNRKVN